MENFDNEIFEFGSENTVDSIDENTSVIPNNINADEFNTEVDSDNANPKDEFRIEDALSSEDDFTSTPLEETASDSSLNEKQDLEYSAEDNKNIDAKSDVDFNDTPIEELTKLTEYDKDDEIVPTDINAIFDKVSVNVKESYDIFNKNTEMKKKLDNKFNELKSLQFEIEQSKKNQIDEIDSYKAEVLQKLNEKKEEIEKRLNVLKDLQATLEKDKKDFETYKKQEQEKIDSIQHEVQEAYDGRRNELKNIEDKLRKQKDSLDEERSQLSLDKIQYESDKNELANNLLKFNELVDSFSNGVSEIKE